MNPFAMITSLYELEHGINGSILLLEMMEVVSISIKDECAGENHEVK